MEPGNTAQVSLDRYQSLLESEKKLIEIKRCENEMVNIPISQFWELMQAREELLNLKFPDNPTSFPVGSKIELTEQEFDSGHVPIEEILAAREKTTGDYGVHAAITDAIKYQMHTSSKWNYLSAMQRESLDMIAHKIGRILAGNPDFRDHWDDIAGYATLIARELK